MRLSPDQIAAVCVTRGDVDLTEILDSWREFGFGEPIVWDNSRRGLDLSVYGRWKACMLAESKVIFTQDDDCVLPPDSFQALLDTHQHGVVVSNTPKRFRDRYVQHCLVGFGAIFDRELVEPTFARFFWRYPEFDREWFHPRSDVVFTALNKRHLVDLPYDDLPWASDSTRMWRQPGHGPQRETMLQLALAARADEGRD